jgi:KGK domain
MNEKKFEALTNEGDVILVQEEGLRGYLNLSHPIFKLSEILREMSCKLISIKKEDFNKNYPQIKWLTDGVNCQALKVGEGIWKTGKLRIKFVVEFCPDEPNSSNSLLKASNSPLDDLRG